MPSCDIFRILVLVVLESELASDLPNYALAMNRNLPQFHTAQKQAALAQW
jgi:hypothetical protein